MNNEKRHIFLFSIDSIDSILVGTWKEIIQKIKKKL